MKVKTHEYMTLMHDAGRIYSFEPLSMLETSLIGEISHMDSIHDRRQSRGCKFWLVRLVGGSVIFVLVLAIAGFTIQSVASALDRRQFQAPGQFYVVDGHRLHLYCVGQGQPTIVLEAGAYSFSSEWYWIEQQLQSSYRVCTYDRAGNGWSETATGERDGLTLVHELHSLLTQASVPGPYVMVGHSLGGVLISIFADIYPDEVLGLVQVDSAVPQRWPDHEAFKSFEEQNRSAYFLMMSMAQFGVLRLILPPEFASYGYPSDVTAVLTAFKATTPGVEVWYDETMRAQWSLSQQFYGIEHLGSLPIAIMWAGHPELTTPEDRERLQSIWNMMPTFSSNSVVRVVSDANHGSITGNELYAQQITQAVRDVIEAAQTKTPLIAEEGL
jgi:pimeloyl-ACP methyl ester carboxylesterase